MSGRLGRGATAITDQAVSALGNVILVISVASSVSADGFGGFALGYATYVVASGVSRAICSEPLIVVSSKTDITKRLIRGSMMSGLLVGICVGLGVAVVGLLISDPRLLTFSVFLPVLLLQDAARMALLATGRPAYALVCDTVWTLGLCALLAVLLLVGVSTVPWFVSAWGLSGAAGAVVACLYLRAGPRFSALRPYWAASGSLKRRYAFEYMGGAGSLQFIHFGIAGVLGLQAIGALRAAQSLLGPFNQLLTGLSVGLMPELVRLKREAPSRLVPTTALISALASALVVVGTLTLMLVPDSLGTRLLGATWAEAQTVLLPAGLAIAGNMVIVGPLLGLRALARARTSLHVRLASSALTVAAAAVTLALGGSLETVAWVLAAAVWLSSTVWWWGYLARFAEFRHTHFDQFTDLKEDVA